MVHKRLLPALPAWLSRAAVRLATGVSVIILASSAAFAAPPELSYFVGTWTVTAKDGDAFTWTVRDEMKGEWLTGVMEKDGEDISSDHWRMAGKNIERYVFTSEGLFIKMTSAGWKAGKMAFTGIASGKTGEFRIRETIFKEGDRRFHAIWEKQTPDGMWSVMSDEICTK
jgi:hypothetical protein